MLAAASAVLALALGTAVVGAAVVARHQAESAADLAALAGASALHRGGDGCAAAARHAARGHASVVSCRVGADATISVVVEVPRSPMLRRFFVRPASARARAGPAGGST